MKFASRLFGKLTFKTTRIVSYRTLSSDKYFNSLIMKDPQAGTTITLRGALSLIIQSKPDISHELYEKPVLVCQPEGDQMTPCYYTKKIFARIKSNRKKFIDFSGAHFPLDKQTYLKWGENVGEFLKENE
jgi:hypothetical protein